MSDCSSSAMMPKEVHCGNMKECVEMGVVVPYECFRHCYGGDSDAVRFERLAHVAREMLRYAKIRLQEHWTEEDAMAVSAYREELERLGVSVDD